MLQFDFDRFQLTSIKNNKRCLVRTWKKKTYASQGQAHFLVRQVTFAAHFAYEPSSE